jgi:hypothetical protein
MERGGILMYNNGDPIMFNAVFNAFSQAINILSTRNVLSKISDMSTLCKLARRPIEVVKGIQKDFCVDGTQLVGSKIHELAVNPKGEYFSGTGDKA